MALVSADRVVQIYNEHVRDLLGSGESLMVVEDPLKGVMIPTMKARGGGCITISP